MVFGDFFQGIVKDGENQAGMIPLVYSPPQKKSQGTHSP
jgi:hypothetical protein